ncbi:ribonuclease HI [Microbacterium esteraromaticum]|uniref:Ribonuclease H n=1 Tax=Microbacterium esteraromaticum TaxID=57043 RepID=A0A939ITZ4_9MICO|nr:ribonuclease H [Microbacterium esteraromaticum]MBN8204891.1 ribonuclease HI [Microbacterium esteraromaticum]MBN8415045.1 ribonuclease HI [Microbacterium esteraromaticum]
MTITAAADGSALGNPGPNGWAWYIDDARWAAGGSAHGTNNQGELRAVLELLRATAGTDEALVIECDSRYVIDSVTKWMPGWKRRGWRKSDGGAVLNRDLLEGIDEAMRGRDVTFTWVKGHAGHPLNEAADERANAAARAYQKGEEPRTGPGFAGAEPEAAAPQPVAPLPPAPQFSAPLWAETTDLFSGFDEPEASAPTRLTVSLTAAEHARLRDRADAQGISLEEALRRLI